MMKKQSPHQHNWFPNHTHTEITGLPSNSTLLLSDTIPKTNQQVLRIFFLDKLARRNVFSDFIPSGLIPQIHMFISYCNQYQKWQR
jgi:hypothetical protein